MKWLLTLAVLVVTVQAQVPPEPQPDPEQAPESRSDSGVPFPYWGRIDGDNVRVRGGPGDFHAVLQQVQRGTPVRVLGKEGPWFKLEVPGGLAVYVALASGTRVYVEEQSPGLGVVRVDDLMVRGDPSTDFPPIGRLNTGDRVMIMDKRDSFARILSPPAVKGYVYEDYVSEAPDQEAVAAEFMTRHRAAEEALLKEGLVSRELLAQEEARRQAALEAEQAFNRFEGERQKAVDQRDTESVKQALAKVRDERPVGDPERERAESLLTTVAEWETAREVLQEARARLEEAARKAAAADERYARDLEALRREREAMEEAGRRGGGAPAYLSQGYVRRSYPVGGVVEPGPPFGLFQGLERKFILESDRYDLSEYANRLVGIVEGEGPMERARLSSRVIKVTRLEILAGR